MCAQLSVAVDAIDWSRATACVSEWSALSPLGSIGVDSKPTISCEHHTCRWSSWAGWLIDEARSLATFFCLPLPRSSSIHWLSWLVASSGVEDTSTIDYLSTGQCSRSLSGKNTRRTSGTHSANNDVTIRSQFCGYNWAECVELMGEDLSCYSNKIWPVSLRKCPHNH